MKLWEGRFSKEVDGRVNDFNSSISVDSRMYKQDIQGSIAHSKMLAKCGIISMSDGEAIGAELEKIRDEITSGALEIDPGAEDIHTFVEQELTKRIGDAGKRLHTARSRNDQTTLDTKLYLKEELKSTVEEIKGLVKVLLVRAEEGAETIMPGYTHLQRAQPVTFGCYMLAYAEMFLRDIDRFECAIKRMDVMPLGSGALAGTTYEINREITRGELGFAAITGNSIDGVSDRDYCIDTAAAASVLMMHLSRFCEELILWCSWEFKFVEMDDGFSTGSSIMPQKKNPDVAELVRGKTGRVYGDLITLLTVMKGLPLAYNKDMQEDKEAVFDAVDTVHACLTVFTPMIETMKLCPKNMRDAAAKGFINATDCADYLVSKGVPFRDAYKATGRLVARCIELGVELETLPLNEYTDACEFFGEDVYDAISLDRCVKNRKVYGGPAPETVLGRAKEIAKALKI